MSPGEYGLDAYQKAILNGFSLSLECIPHMGGVQYRHNYDVLKDYAMSIGMNPLELLDICSGLRDALQKNV